MNAEEISLKVKDYFEKVRSMKAYFFNIDSCELSMDKRWLVRCNFISNPFAGNEVQYDVVVENGAVCRVSKVYNKVD